MQKFKRLATIIVSIWCLCILSSNSYADSSVLVNTESGDATIKVKNGWVSIKSDDPENTAVIQDINVSEVIFDTVSETLYVIDHTEKTISQITQANVEQLGSTINTATDVLDSMPQEQRESIAGLMRGFGIDVPETSEPNQVELSPLSEQQFRGITCLENSVIEDNQEIGRICVTQSNTTPLSNEDYQTVLKTQDFFLMLAKQAQPFAKQYGQSVPNLSGVNLSGLVVYSNQIQVESNTPPASFVVTAIDTSEVNDITLPTDYQSRSLFSTTSKN